MSKGVPVGTVVPYVGALEIDAIKKELENDGWLCCDGSPLSCINYAELYAKIGMSFGGTMNEFNLPDLRGMFLRGVDAGAGVDPDALTRKTHTADAPNRKAGTEQACAVQEHAHVWHGYKVSTLVHGETRECMSKDWISEDPEIDFPAKDPGHETRPVNVAVWYIIMYKTVE